MNVSFAFPVVARPERSLEGIGENGAGAGTGPIKEPDKDFGGHSTNWREEYKLE